MRLVSGPCLSVRHASPTTAEFTVTTCPPMTMGLRLALLALVFARLAVLVGAAFLAHAALAASPIDVVFPIDVAAVLPVLPPSLRPHVVKALLAVTRLTAPARALAALAVGACPWWTALACAMGLACGAAAGPRLHATESLLVLRGLGIQTASSGWGWAGSTTTRFIPTEKIRDVLINEAFCGFQVRYYLVVVVEAEADLVVVFPRLRPSRRIVQAVWRGARACLYDPDGVRKLEKV